MSLPNDSSGHPRAQIESLIGARRYPEALRLIATLEAEHPGDRDLLYARAYCLAATGDMEEARQAAQTLSAIYADPRGAQLLAKLSAAKTPTAGEQRPARTVTQSRRRAITFIAATVLLLLVAGVGAYFQLSTRSEVSTPTVPAELRVAGSEQSFEIAPGVSMAFVWIPPGSFMMGSALGPSEISKRYGGKAEWFADEYPQRRVEITRGFWLGKYEVTQAEWMAVTGSNSSELQGSRRPVERATWYECQLFLRKLGGDYRLPTEAEWEYACRAGTGTAYSFGDDASSLDAYAWYGGSKIHDVGQKRPNAWGLHDMHGNVWEWCTDQSDGTSAPLLRGGAWDDEAVYCRAAYRYTDTEDSYAGFRVVRTSD